MRSYMIYGLDRDGRVGHSQTVKLSLDEAKTVASDLLTKFQKVEVWDGGACVFRTDRRKA